MEEDW